MIDTSRPNPRKRGTLPAFAPVPRKCRRHDGWTAERQRGFIEALADLGSVRAAAHAVNMTPESAYQLRRHAEAGEFRKAWEAALALGVQRLEDIAMDRALNGVEVPVYSYGKLIGTRRVYNDALLMFMLRNRAPKRFTADSWHNTDAATRSRLKRLKREWREQWEAEHRAEAERDEEEVLDSIDAKLGAMRQRWLDGLSPKARAAYEAWERAEEEEDQRALEWTPKKDGRNPE
ncbi:MAG: hypothetical protein R3E09_12945 [Novosphingobium sp.]